MKAETIGFVGWQALTGGCMGDWSCLAWLDALDGYEVEEALREIRLAAGRDE